jgi:hypothetical protein
MALQAELFTEPLSNASITLDGSEGVRAIVVYNSSAVTGTVTGSKKLGSRSPAPISVGENVTWSHVALEGSVLSGLTITAPAGCTLEVTAQI